MENRNVIERVASLETGLRSHIDFTDKVIERLEEMHKDHYENNKSTSILLANSISDLHDIANNFKQYVIDSRESIKLVDKRIDTYVTYFTKYFLAVIGAISLPIFVFFLQYFFKK